MENITFILDDDPIEESSNSNMDCNISALLKDFEDIKIDQSGTQDVYVEMKYYDMTYNTKQLLTICEYYGIHKGVNKMKKQDIIEQLVLFEHHYENIDLVRKRKEMWYYINELKNDKMMKRFILW